MKDYRLAVHIHIFYKHMWKEIKSYLNNITIPYDLYVTLVDDDKNLISDIKIFHKEAKVWIVENRGYDVGPFIDFLNKINLNDYDYILKLHTKGHSGKNKFTDLFKERYVYFEHKDLWNDLLIKSLVGTKNIFEKNLSHFSKDEKLGMIGSKYLICNLSKSYKKSLPQIPGLKYPKASDIKFIAGTMFMVKSPLLQPIKDNFKISNFEPTDGKVKDKALAHYIERLFGCVVLSQGCKIKGFDKSWIMRIIQPLNFAKKFIFDFTKTCQGYYKIKIFRIQILKFKELW